MSKQNLSKSRAGYDKEFLGLKLKEILSWDISSKFTNILKDYNRKLLDKLLNTEKCGKYFSELFELTFSQCLEHIQEKKNYDLLNGLMNCRKMFETFCDKEEINDENYYLNFETILMTYQNFIGKNGLRHHCCSRNCIFFIFAKIFINTSDADINITISRLEFYYF